MSGRVVVLLVSVYCRAVTFCRRVDEAAENLMAGFALEATSGDEKRRLTVERYDSGRANRGSDVFEWERAWYEQRLPPAPARVLVGGCGAGREMIWLRSRGYSVAGFDPAPSMVTAARSRAANGIDIVRSSYEELVHSILRPDPGTPPPPILQGAYDAVILGWTSLSHVLDADARADLFAALNRLCPGGPILGSYWETGDGQTSTRGRAWRIGCRLGTAVRRLRRLPGPSPAIVFRPHAGFACVFTRAEIAQLAQSAGRVAIFEHEGWCAHATFVPVACASGHGVKSAITGA